MEILRREEGCRLFWALIDVTFYLCRLQGIEESTATKHRRSGVLWCFRLFRQEARQGELQSSTSSLTAH